MLTQFIRVFKGAAAGAPETITLTDVSLENAERTVHLFAQKYLYIAQKFPFNNLFIMLGAVANAQTGSKIKIEYWNGADEWVEAKDVLDFTKGLQRSGLIQFQLDNSDSWDSIPETDLDDEGSSIPEELVDLSINDCHWLRISFTGDPVDALTQIKHITYAFTTTEKINAVDVQASRYYETFASGKANWMDEILVGSEMMIADMKAAGLLKSAGQIILLDDFVLPCAWRVLEHIYSQMGTSYDGRRGEVKALYKAFLAGPKTLDKNSDAKIDPDEEGTSSSRMYR